MSGAGQTARIFGVVAILCTVPVPDARATPACAAKAGPSHNVLKVIDGETLLLDDGQEVRLIGALPPLPDTLRTAAADWPPAREARRILEDLVGSRTISLGYGGRRQDRYGRTLAQVSAPGADGDTWIQHRLISQGYARAYALPGSSACVQELMAAEAEARAARRGLWGSGLFSVSRAEDVDPLLRRVGRFAIVQGRVAQVSRAQRTTYINFGQDWRHDFTASLASSTVDRSDGGAARASALAGKEIRVRGWIERRNGPMIVLGSLDEIEVLDEAGETAGAGASDGRACSAPHCEAGLGEIPTANGVGAPPPDVPHEGDGPHEGGGTSR